MTAQCDLCGRFIPRSCWTLWKDRGDGKEEMMDGICDACDERLKEKEHPPGGDRESEGGIGNGR